MGTLADGHVSEVEEAAHPIPAEFPFFILAEGDVAVMLGDFVRVLAMASALVLVGVLTRMIWQQRSKRPVRWRFAAYVCFLISVAGTEYIRLGDPVSSRLPLNMLGILFTALSIRASSQEFGAKSPTWLEK